MRAHTLLSRLVLLLISIPVFAQTPAAGPWDIAVDVGTDKTPPSVNPAKPVARIGDDDYLSIQILEDGKPPRDDRAQLRFAQRVLKIENDHSPIALTLRTITRRSVADEFVEQGASHLIRFRKCSMTYLSQFKIDGRAATKDDCPFVVSSEVGNVTVYANTDSIALDAEVDTQADPNASKAFAPQNTRHVAFTIRTVRPWWNLNFSTGFSFFGGSRIRDEQYRLAPVPDDPSTPNVDESKTTDQLIVPAGHGETPYELGAFATYMLHRPSNLPIGITFGVSTKIPVDQLTALAGLSVRIEPFPIVNSAYITAGIAYRGHKVLMAKYRDTLRAPAGVSETDILETRHDVGFVVAASFGFGGGESEFKKVVSGQ